MTPKLPAAPVPICASDQMVAQIAETRLEDWSQQHATAS